VKCRTTSCEVGHVYLGKQTGRDAPRGVQGPFDNNNAGGLTCLGPFLKQLL